MRRFVLMTILSVCIAAVIGTVANAAPKQGKGGDAIQKNALRMLEEGKHTFRFDTFGDEAFWGDTLKLHQVMPAASWEPSGTA